MKNLLCCRSRSLRNSGHSAIVAPTAVLPETQIYARTFGAHSYDNKSKLSPKRTPCWTGGQRIWFKMTYLGPSPYNPLIISSEFVNKNRCCCYSFIAGLEFVRRGIHLKLQLRPKKKKASANNHLLHFQIDLKMLMGYLFIILVLRRWTKLDFFFIGVCHRIKFKDCLNGLLQIWRLWHICKL